MTDATIPSALSIAGLSHVIGGRRVLDDVGFSLPTGRFGVLLGLNGAGKTTLFSLITGLYDAQQGTIQVFGRDLRRHRGAALADIGVVFQQRAVDPGLSALENLRYHADLHGLPRALAQHRIDEELARCGLAGKARQAMRRFSGGEVRRIEIARALLHQPRLLLCDEPTVGLDVHARAGLLADVRALVAGHGLSVLWATHLIDEIADDDHLIILHQGRLRWTGQSAALKAQQNGDLAAAFQRVCQGATQ